MKETIKLLTVLVIILCVIMSATMVFAAGEEEGEEGAATTTDIDPQNMGNANVNVTKIGNIGAGLATVIRNVGIVLSVIILMVLGIKYMMGSAQEKAEYKKTMIPYIIGAILLFGAAAIAQAVISAANTIVQ